MPGPLCRTRDYLMALTELERKRFERAASQFIEARRPPPEIRSEEDVLAYVRFNRGAIGYVSSQTNLSGVHIVNVVE